MSTATGSPVRAVVRVRLAPCLPWQAFEQWPRAIADEVTMRRLGTM
jgi:hypothetical protein